MTKQEFWTAENVSSFNGYTVSGGEVELTNSEYEEVLNEIFGDVQVCGQSFGSGSLLVDADPTSFSCMKGDYESSLQSDLESQLGNEDSSGIEFIDGDEFELDDEEEEDNTYQDGYNARTNDEDFDHSKSDEWQNGWNDADIKESTEE